ncbi:MAG: nucleoside monophosphate kinase [Candidatus Shapirobacteria bacterium]|nr:nucleoside monophosphate kinase [Candidatus Shapirobacteria bacterium]
MPKCEKISLIAFTGPEGSGKSTQAEYSAKFFCCPYVSTGNILREAARNDKSELGDACRKMFKEHVYLSPSRILDVLRIRLQQKDVDQGVILDGGFRTIEETECFPAMLEKTGKTFAVNVVYLRVPLWKCAERLMSEGGRKREDDTPAAWLKRLKEFNTGLGIRMSLIRHRWSLQIIDGNKPEKEIFEEISKRISPS